MGLVNMKMRTVGFIPGVPRWKSQVNKAKKGAWERGGQFWHLRLRSKHFTKAGAREYHYTPRKGEAGSGVPFKTKKYESYQAYKLRRFHHTRPLEKTGELKRLSRMARITSTSKGVRVALSAANKANLRHPNSTINMREELTTISVREEPQIAREIDRELNLRLNRIKTVNTKTL